MSDVIGLSKNKKKYLLALQSKKHRQKYNKFVVEGDKIAREFLSQNLFPPELIFATSSWIETNKKLLKVHFNKVITLSESELKQVSSLTTPNQVLVVADIHSWALDGETVSKGLALYLDGIRDPGNMGTILRIADWFGISTVYCSPDCVDLYMSKVVQAAMGAILRVPTAILSLEELTQSNPEWPVYGTVLDGSSVYEQTLPEAGLIVIGNEGRGIKAENLKLLHHKISLPSAQESGMESLNAAVATGIFCALFRQPKA